MSRPHPIKVLRIVVWNMAESLSSTKFNQSFLKMSAQRQRKLHRLFGRLATAVPPPSLAAHPTPTQPSLCLTNSSIPTQYVSGLLI